jgi:nucleotide-binding universal stress UspA family protein
MVSISSILVDIDALASEHPAFEQAVDLATRCRASLKIVDVLPLVPPSARHFVTADLERELVDHRASRLAAVATGVEGVAVTTELLRGRPANAVTQEVLRSAHDLLVRSHERDLAHPPRRFGAVDMELLRHCPCPVWLIGRSHRRASRVLAAVHADPPDPVQQQLNTTILEWALMLRELGGAELTLLQAWTMFGASVLKSRLSPEEFTACLEAARRQAEESLDAFTAPLADRLGGVDVRVVEGEAAEVIARFVESSGIDVVVMGTVARTGIAGLVMGNTAERVLQHLRGSVLAVKPPGFRSPDVRG